MRALRLLAPLPAIAVGVVVAARIDVAPLVFLPNVVGVVFGVLIVLGARQLDRRVLRWLPVIAALLTTTTLLSSGSDGVHRWLAAGPLQLHLSSLLTPWLLVGIVADDEHDRRVGFVAVVVIQLVHVLQPDAGQATALAVALLPTTLQRRSTVDVGVFVVVAVLGLVAWQRPDPLLPVAHVERVLFLAADSGWLLVVALLALGLLVLPLTSSPTALAYLTTTVAVTVVGHFPVPVLGAGAGPVLGWYSLLAVVGCDRRRHAPARAPG